MGEKSLSESIISVLSGGDAKEGFKVKKLRKMVLLSLQQDDSDKSAKKGFKKAIQALEEEGIVKLDEDGQIFLKKEKKQKGEKKKKKRSAADESEEEKPKRIKTSEKDDVLESQAPAMDDGRKDIPVTESPPKKKSVPCKGNPSGITRLFVGNLPFAVDETGLGDFIPGITHIKWITDKETGRFYGSAFVEMDTNESAAAAVAKTGQELMGRSVKINFAPARPGDVWPPQKPVQTGGGQAGGTGRKAMGEKPEGCLKLFIGNLSYEIDDDAITKFFAAVDAELKAVRWLHHRESGDFKGCGFVEFWNTEACEKAAALNGKNLLGRPIRIDWTD